MKLLKELSVYALQQLFANKQMGEGSYHLGEITDKGDSRFKVASITPNDLFEVQEQEYLDITLAKNPLPEELVNGLAEHDRDSFEAWRKYRRLVLDECKLENIRFNGALGYNRLGHNQDALYVADLVLTYEQFGTKTSPQGEQEPDTSNVTGKETINLTIGLTKELFHMGYNRTLTVSATGAVDKNGNPLPSPVITYRNIHPEGKAFGDLAVTNRSIGWHGGDVDDTAGEDYYTIINGYKAPQRTSVEKPLFDLLNKPGKLPSDITVEQLKTSNEARQKLFLLSDEGKSYSYYNSLDEGNVLKAVSLTQKMIMPSSAFVSGSTHGVEFQLAHAGITPELYESYEVVGDVANAKTGDEVTIRITPKDNPFFLINPSFEFDYVEQVNEAGESRNVLKPTKVTQGQLEVTVVIITEEDIKKHPFAVGMRAPALLSTKLLKAKNASDAAAAPTQYATETEEADWLNFLMNSAVVDAATTKTNRLYKVLTDVGVGHMPYTTQGEVELATKHQLGYTNIPVVPTQFLEYGYIGEPLNFGTADNPVQEKGINEFHTRYVVLQHKTTSEQRVYRAAPVADLMSYMFKKTPVTGEEFLGQFIDSTKTVTVSVKGKNFSLRVPGNNEIRVGYKDHDSNGGEFNRTIYASNTGNVSSINEDGSPVAIDTAIADGRLFVVSSTESGVLTKDTTESDLKDLLVELFGIPKDKLATLTKYEEPEDFKGDSGLTFYHIGVGYDYGLTYDSVVFGVKLQVDAMPGFEEVTEHEPAVATAPVLTKPSVIR